MSPTRIALLVASLGVAFDLCVNGQAPGAGAAVFLTAVAIAMRLSAPTSLERDLLLGGATASAWLLAWRADPEMILVNGAVAATLLGVAATGPGATRLSIPHLLERALVLARATFDVPVAVLAPLAKAMPHGAAVTRAARTIAVAAPVLLTFAFLLGSADRVFADAILPDLPPLRLGSAAGHVFLTIFGMLLAGPLWLARAVPIGDRERSRLLRPVEWITTLAGMALLFAAFAATQATYLSAHVRPESALEIRPGLTYAEHARQGFFQLLVVAGLTAVVIVGVWDRGRRDDLRSERWFRVLSTMLIALCGVMLWSASLRLRHYQDALGYTVLRIAAWFAIAWVGVTLTAIVVAIYRNGRRHVLAAAAAAAVLSVAAANAVSPSKLAARANVERLRATGKLDVAYLSSLGPDAAAVLADAIPKMKQNDAAVLRDAVCDHLDTPRGWRSWNAGRARAREEAARIGCAGDGVSS